MVKFLAFVAVLALIIWLWRRSRSAALTEAEARALLGVDTTADAEAIRAAHRRLIAKVHPDAGGNEELARRINAARDTLLKNLPPPTDTP